MFKTSILTAVLAVLSLLSLTTTAEAQGLPTIVGSYVHQNNGAGERAVIEITSIPDGGAQQFDVLITVYDVATGDVLYVYAGTTYGVARGGGLLWNGTCVEDPGGSTIIHHNVGGRVDYKKAPDIDHADLLEWEASKPSVPGLSRGGTGARLI